MIIKINVGLVIGLLLLFSLKATSQTNSCEKQLELLCAREKIEITPEEFKKFIPCIFQIQNEGFAYDELECKYDSARLKIQLALTVWKTINDSLQQANLLKYLGYLNGRLGNFTTAKHQIHEAIRLYRYKNADFGVAVTLYNLARIYEYENNLDSAFFFVREAETFWKSQGDTSRLMILNTYFLHLVSKGVSLSNYTSVIDENIYFLKANDIYWQNELDFYFVTYILHTYLKDTENASKYEHMYQQKIEAHFKSNGTLQYSIYDPRNCP